MASGPTASPSHTPTDAELTAALLTASEVPGGGFAAEPASSAAGVEPTGYCSRLTAAQPDALDQVQAVFRGGQYGPFVIETLVQFTPANARAMLAQTAAVPTACGTLTTVVSGYRVALSVTPLTPVHRLGDQTVALSVNLTFVDYPGVTASGDIVVINIVFPSNTDLTWRIADAAYARVAARW